MKKIFLILCFIFAQINLAQAEEQQEIDEIRQQVEKYTKECYNKSYPVDDPEKMDYILSLYNTSIKKYMKEYNKCLKEIIVEKIKQTPSITDTSKIIKILDEIEQSTLKFYNLIATQTDMGIVGAVWDDTELGRRYEAILHDVLWYQSIYGEKLE